MKDVCAIWGTPAEQSPVLGDYDTYDSPRAGGRYRVARSLLKEARWHNKTAEDCEKLTKWIAEQHSSGETEPLISGYVFEQL
ncbi:hypothetical protein J2X36_005360 [Methylobacterium sp. BE186]|uniref:hypothetical protein n=1 Tax=Methylobacterium sp. BE186 TaxID=2817715 RepID=UPI0028677851|nr:hypothetical protein [Methylobacterium sp. BE186]MDR7040577.1 hypothetical protein [Methylobacterium sp. BE186]